MGSAEGKRPEFVGATIERTDESRRAHQRKPLRINVRMGFSFAAVSLLADNPDWLPQTDDASRI